MTEVLITALGQYGEGVAEVDGTPVYVPFTLPGDRAEIEADGPRWALRQLLQPGEHRITPSCGHFAVCGGCALQHLDATTYATFKRGLVENALRHAGVEASVAPLLDATGRGRRRATLHARGRSAGYMRARSHDVLDIDRCPILVPALQSAALAITRAIAAIIGDCDVSLTATLTGTRRLGADRQKAKAAETCAACPAVQTGAPDPQR